MSVSAQSPSDRSVVWGRFRRYAAAATHQIRARSGGKGRCYSAKLHAMHLNFGLLRLFMILHNIVEPQLRGSCPHYEIRRLLTGTFPVCDRFFSFLSLRRPRGGTLLIKGRVSAAVRDAPASVRKISKSIMIFDMRNAFFIHITRNLQHHAPFPTMACRCYMDGRP